MRNQIEAVLFQESLGDDFREVFGLAHPLGNFLRNKSTKSALSPTARGNLARFLEEDYRVIRELHSIGKIPEARFQAILAGTK